jgi:hypothetical protein
MWCENKKHARKERQSSYIVLRSTVVPPQIILTAMKPMPSSKFSLKGIKKRLRKLFRKYTHKPMDDYPLPSPLYNPYREAELEHKRINEVDHWTELEHQTDPGQPSRDHERISLSEDDTFPATWTNAGIEVDIYKKVFDDMNHEQALSRAALDDLGIWSQAAVERMKGTQLPSAEHCLEWCQGVGEVSLSTVSPYPWFHGSERIESVM